MPSNVHVFDHPLVQHKLTLLRKKDSTAADQRYAAMLASTSNNMLADANTVSLLSSYIFTPNTYVIFNTDGAATGSFMPTATPANVSPQLRLAFFQTANAVLLRPQQPPDQDQSTTGIAGKYMVIKRLLPLFEQHAPSEIVASMRSQFHGFEHFVEIVLARAETKVAFALAYKYHAEHTSRCSKTRSPALPTAARAPPAATPLPRRRAA